jgi:VPDSG-CTERM motif
MYKTKLAIAVIVALFALSLNQAHATFVVNTDFKGELKLFNDVAHKNVTEFTATVGGHTGPAVDVKTDGPVDSGAGFANITPVHGTSLVSLVFTPADNTLFSDFSFRGQLTQAGTVTVTVVDSDGFSFTFTTATEGKDDDIPRFGVISLDGETIDHVTITANSFKEFKQVEFSFGNPSVPDGGASVMLLGMGLTGLGLVRRYIKR